MAATRLSDAQKQEIVARYQDGVSSAELAEAYGCSPNTVSRVVKASLSPEVYAALKQQRSSRPSRAVAATAPAAEAVVPAAAPLPPPVAEHGAEPSGAGQEPAGAGEVGENGGPGVLAIDDADDFAADATDDDDDQELDDAGDDDETPLSADAHEPVQCRCLSEANLPDSAYLLVDKTVELQPTPLRDCTELGQLPDGEEERQALLVYANQRQAKRHCGRSQRVIQLPDVALLQRTAPYLLAKGISRVVIDGSLYSLPGS